MSLPLVPRIFKHCSILYSRDLMQWDLKSTQIMTLFNPPIRNSIMPLFELIYMTRGRIIVTGKLRIDNEIPSIESLPIRYILTLGVSRTSSWSENFYLEWFSEADIYLKIFRGLLPHNHWAQRQNDLLQAVLVWAIGWKSMKVVHKSMWPVIVVGCRMIILLNKTYTVKVAI